MEIQPPPNTAETVAAWMLANPRLPPKVVNARLSKLPFLELLRLASAFRHAS